MNKVFASIQGIGSFTINSNPKLHSSKSIITFWKIVGSTVVSVTLIKINNLAMNTKQI